LGDDAGKVSDVHRLNMHTVAEGVETADQLRALRLMKCDQAQGYLCPLFSPASRSRQQPRQRRAVAQTPRGRERGWSSEKN
jgi:EAL domain-containing protein (putative c-di-GMP-specific phosphodiesterase class I)